MIEPPLMWVLLDNAWLMEMESHIWKRRNKMKCLRLPQNCNPKSIKKISVINLQKVSLTMPLILIQTIVWLFYRYLNMSKYRWYKYIDDQFEETPQPKTSIHSLDRCCLTSWVAPDLCVLLRLPASADAYVCIHINIWQLIILTNN